jgi:hypothetical protein
MNPTDCASDYFHQNEDSCNSLITNDLRKHFFLGLDYLFRLPVAYTQSVEHFLCVKRSPLNRRKPLRSTTPHARTHARTPARARINPVSKKRRQQQTEYSRLRKEYLTTHPRCECCDTSPASEIHHRRGRYKSRLNDIVWWLAICRPCHDRIHHNPAWAYEKGLLVAR